MQNETVTTGGDQAAAQQFVREVYQRAATLANEGKSKDKIRTELSGMGLNEETASKVVENVFRLRKKAGREAGLKNAMVGAGWCVGGIAVTVLTYELASGGGFFVVTWGAILFGGIQFVKGLGQFAINL
jgi:hypothetical protein